MRARALVTLLVWGGSSGVPRPLEMCGLAPSRKPVRQGEGEGEGDPLPSQRCAVHTRLRHEHAWLTTCLSCLSLLPCSPWEVKWEDLHKQGSM